MRRHCAAACALVVALAAGVGPPVSHAEPEPAPQPEETVAEETADEEIGNFLLAQIAQKRQQAWRWERLMRVKLSPATKQAERSNSREVRQRILVAWSKKAKLRALQANNPPRLHAWLCIFRHERHPAQGWRSRTGNGYYGGLQMDLDFQRTYGPELLRRKGTADRWTAIEQIWIAERAYRSGRGFYPWPNTARYCGLI